MDLSLAFSFSPHRFRLLRPSHSSCNDFSLMTFIVLLYDVVSPDDDINDDNQPGIFHPFMVATTAL